MIDSQTMPELLIDQRPVVLIVDDAEPNRILLRDQVTLLGYRSVTAADGVEGLACLREARPSLILLDLSMPVMDGETMLRHLMADEDWSRIPVIIISGLDDIDTVARCIEIGAEGYLVKPYRPSILKARIRSSMAKVQLHDREQALRRMTEQYNEELERRVQEQVRQISKAHLSTLFALSTLAESRDPETGAHLDRMRNFCRVLARALRFTPPYNAVIDDKFIEDIYAASPLHDIGKVGVPDHVLLKPGKLTPEEFAMMQEHCAIGEATLRRVSDEFPENRLLRMGIDIAASHHEKWDGSGYPRGLAGEAIPMAARILALCDVYDALSSKRCYKEAFSHDKSRDIILEGRGKHFDPKVVDAFVLVEEEFIRIRARYEEADAPASMVLA